MMAKGKAARTIDEYVASFPADVQARLSAVRRAVQEALPDGQEAIKYLMPTFVQNGNVVHFAAFKNHIGFYGAPTQHPSVVEDAAPYCGPKGSLNFPHGERLPIGLIKRLAKLKAQQNAARSPARRKA